MPGPCRCPRCGGTLDEESDLVDGETVWNSYCPGCD